MTVIQLRTQLNTQLLYCRIYTFLRYMAIIVIQLITFYRTYKETEKFDQMANGHT